VQKERGPPTLRPTPPTNEHQALPRLRTSFPIAREDAPRPGDTKHDERHRPAPRKTAGQSIPGQTLTAAGV